MSLLPSWTRCELGNLCDLLTDGTHHSPLNANTGDFLYITARNVKLSGLDLNRATYVSRKVHTEIFKRAPVGKGDILLIKDGATAGIAAINNLEQEFSLLSSVALIRVKKDIISNRFLWYWFRLPQTQGIFSDAMNGTAIRRITLSSISRLILALPPLAEQGRIISELDALTKRIARARAELERVPALTAKLRASTLASAYSGKLAGVESVRYASCEGWINSTFYGPRFGKDDYITEGVPTVRTTDFQSDGTMLLDDAPHVACDGSDFEKWSLQDGDLLVTRTGSIGKCAVYSARQGPALPSAYLIRVRLNQKVLPNFAWMTFASPQGQEHLGVSSRAVTQPNINAAAIRSLPVPLLTIEQQRATVRAVERQFTRADRLEAEAARAAKLLDRLEASILARAFRGELVPQDPADEPASALLDRIRAERAAAPKAKRGRRAAPA